jgi:hypothetical protein
MVDQRHTGFHNRALMRGIQHHAAGHVKDLSFCLKDPSEIELIFSWIRVHTGREIILFGTEHFSYWLEQMQERGAHFQ